MTTLQTDLATLGGLVDSLHGDTNLGAVLQVKVVQGVASYLFRYEGTPGEPVEFTEASTLVEYLTRLNAGEEQAPAVDLERLNRLVEARAQLDVAIAALTEDSA